MSLGSSSCLEHGFGEAPPFHCTIVNTEYKVGKYDQDSLNFKLNELKFNIHILSFKIHFIKFRKSPSGAPYAGHIKLQQDASS